MDQENQGATPDGQEIIEQPQSMDDTIRDILQSQRERAQEPEAPAMGQAAPAAKAMPEAPEEAAQRIRDNQGKFAAKQPAAPAVGEEAGTPAIPAPAAEPVAGAPNTWKKEVAAHWASLPPDVQAEVNRREADFHKGIEQYRAAATFAQSMEKTIAPYMATMQALKVTPERAINELLAFDHQLRYGSQQQKQQLFAQLAQTFGIDTANLQMVEQQPVDPNVAALQQQVNQLNGFIQNQQMTAQQQAEAQLNSEISAFAADPSHSHFETVKSHMAALLQAGLARDLPDAYEQAVNANPATRAAMVAEQQRAIQADLAEKAKAAKAAASTNVRARPAMPVAKPIGTMDDTIRETLRRLTGAA